MREIGRYWLYAFILLGCLAATAGAGEESSLYRLRRDPFDFSAIKPPENRVEEEVIVEAPPVTFELRATLVSKQQSVANLNGKILMEGEEIDGYRLRKIGEDEVVLEKDGKQVVVSLKHSRQAFP